MARENSAIVISLVGSPDKLFTLKVGVKDLGLGKCIFVPTENLLISPGPGSYPEEDINFFKLSPVEAKYLMSRIEGGELTKKDVTVSSGLVDVGLERLRINSATYGYAREVKKLLSE
jgi:hypothetical protein